MLNLLKICAIGFWLTLLTALCLPQLAPWRLWIVGFLAVTILAHAGECLLFLPRLKQMPGALVKHLACVLLMGGLYWFEMRKYA